MKSNLGRFLGDRWNNILIYFAAYLFLIVAIKGVYSVTGRVLLSLIGVWIVIFLARVVLLYFRLVSSQNRHVKKEQLSIGEKVKDGYVNLYVRFIGYLILLGVILGSAFEGMWVIYILVGLLVIAALVQLIVKREDRKISLEIVETAKF